MVWSSWTWIAFNVVGRIKSEESLVKTRPNYLVLALWQTRLRKSCLVYTMKKTTLFFEEEANLPCILANLIVDLSQTETAKWAPWVSLLSCTFLEEIYNLQIFVAPYSLLWYVWSWWCLGWCFKKFQGSLRGF